MVDVLVNCKPSKQSFSQMCRGVVVGLIVIFLLGEDAHAGLQGCPDDTARNDKLLIGSMDMVSPISERRRRALLAAFEMHFDKADASLGSLAKVIYCPQRRLRDRNTYDADVTGVLNDERVLLEVGARVSGGDIIVAYVVIPLRHYGFHNVEPPRMQGYHEALYEQAQIDAGLDKLFRGNAELRLFSALALGLRHERAADSAVHAQEQKTMLLRSRAFYCDAIGTLEAAKPRPDYLGLEPDEWQALGNFAREGADRVYRQTLDSFGDQSTLPILREIRGSDADDKGLCVDPLPSQTDGGGQ